MADPDEKPTRPRWEADRSWDVIKWVGGISAAVSVIAAIALVGLVVRLSLAVNK